jgi:hypothetical protein
VDEAREAWCFGFYVHATAPINGQLMDELQQEAAAWAEARCLDVVGRHWSASPTRDGAARCWHFRFDLRAGGGERVVPAWQAGELERQVRSWCDRRALDLAAPFGMFAAEEPGPGQRG